MQKRQGALKNTGSAGGGRSISFPRPFVFSPEQRRATSSSLCFISFLQTSHLRISTHVEVLITAGAAVERFDPAFVVFEMTIVPAKLLGAGDIFFAMRLDRYRHFHGLRVYQRSALEMVP